MRRSNRADVKISMTMVMGLAFFVVLLLVLLSYNNRIKNGERFTQRWIAEDLGLLTDTVIGYPYTIEVVFPVDEKMAYEFDNYFIKVYKKNQSRLTSEVVMINPSQHINFFTENITEHAEFLNILKEGDNIWLSPAKQAPNFEAIVCKEGQTGKLDGIVVDARAGGNPGDYHDRSADERGAVNRNDPSFTESKIAYEIALGISGPEVVLTRPDQVYVSNEKRVRIINQHPSFAYMGIGVAADYDNTKKPLRAYIRADSDVYDQSYRLACVLLNEIKQKVPGFTSEVIIPIQPDWYDSDHSFLLMPRDRPAVYLEIGNIHVDSDKNELSNPVDISNGISEGLNGYGE